MKILILTNSSLGLYLFRKELVEDMLNKQFEVSISSPYQRESDLLGEMGCNFIATQIDRRGINPFKDTKLFLNYFRLIKREKPDVVLTYTVKPNLYGGFCCKLLKVPYISNVTGLGSGFGNKILKILLKIMYNVALGKKSHIFVQNEENLGCLTQMHLKPKSIELIPGSGVNLEKYRYLEYPDKDEIDFFFVSRVMKEKGIDEYLEAVKYCRKKGYNANFHIFGWCEEAYEDTLNRLNSEGVIVYHGMCSDMQEQYGYNSCIVHPSYHEGMSNVLLEASASGRPCICSNISGCKEIVEDGVTGFLAEPQDLESLIRAIEKFISLDVSQRREMGIRAREKVEKDFDRKIVVEKYMDKIDEIARSRV